MAALSIENKKTFASILRKKHVKERLIQLILTQYAASLAQRLEQRETDSLALLSGNKNSLSKTH